MKRLFELLDKIAGRWLDWHADYAIHHNPEMPQMMAELGLKKFEVGQGRIDATFFTPAAAILADGMAQMLNAANAENYVQFDMLPRLDRGLRPVRVTVQWASGESPAAQNARLRAEVSELKQQLAEASNDLPGI